MTEEVDKLYSEAIFQLCIEENCLDSIHKTLNEYDQVFKDYPELKKLLSVPTLSLKEKVDVISKLFENDGIAYNFLCVLSEKNRIKHINRIISEFNKMYNEHNNITEIKVTTSVALTDELREKLKTKLEGKTGKKVKLIENIDKSIIGGVILDYGNTQVDNSIKGKLAAVSKQLKQV